MRVKAAETGNVSFRSEAAEVIIGEKPAAKYETPDIRIDYTAETLTGFAPGAEYAINGKNITASADGVIKIEADWFGTTLSIVRKGNGNDKLDSNAQSLPVPARPQKPTPIGVDVSTAGETGKMTGLTADTIYEVSNDGGKIWVSHTADGSGQITGLAPGAYVVRVKAGTSNFVSEPSDPAQIGAYPIKVTFMVDGAKYKEITVHYGAALTDIPPVPTKENAVGAWCMDEQGTAPVEGVAKKSGGKPSNSGGGDKKDEPESTPTPPPSKTSDNTSSIPPVNPPTEVTPPAPETTSPSAEKESEGRKPGTTPEQEKGGEREPESTGTQEPEEDSADAVQTEKEPQAEKKEVKVGNGTVIVTMVCEEEKCTAAVADTEKVVKAVLTSGQQELVNGGETIEIRIDVTDISDQVPEQDKDVIEGGIEAYREEAPGLVLGMYVDISMFIRIGAGDWNAITETKEPIEVVIGISEELQSDGRVFYIIRAHEGAYTFMNDLDDAPDTITVSTDLFSSYAIAYAEADETGTDDGAKCGLCHICPTFLGICYFIWLAVIIALGLILYIMWRKKRQKEEKNE